MVRLLVAAKEQRMTVQGHEDYYAGGYHLVDA